MTKRKSSEERRHEIANAAIKIIGEKGLRKFTTAQIAEEVGIKDGTIFRHFKNKREILALVIDRIEEMLVATAFLPRGEPLERIEAFLTSRVATVASNPALLSLLLSDQIAHAAGDMGQRRISSLRNRGREFLRSSLQEAVDHGDLPADTDVESGVILINGMVLSILLAAKDEALDAPVKDVANRTWKTLLQLLKG
ncbi:TetR/AcrR family transcriptional regulator [Bradymonas sediminis]|uniref:Uncharacterized protein n=1 Tax=Bradymonas sediminis TaxID=1548548 RepID=A0A2Z4FIP9_9DELT|nr:TetR/AcrR family transcriptional regulator [Bradymonas sediminis]AWV88822.1 hypothetical protein DN745_05505 [Bradymonas sediminis]TDP71823.1 TetR family transcriptional regulator [Bradymonas sediminis]